MLYILQFHPYVYSYLKRGAALGEGAADSVDTAVYQECVIARVGEIAAPKVEVETTEVEGEVDA